jgi:hypothetical protein
LIFEALAKLSPKGSVTKEVLAETSKMLKGKNGVESIDVNQFIELLFEKADYFDILDDEHLIDSISIKETFSEIDSIDELIEIILKNQKELPEKEETPVEAEDRVDEKEAKDDAEAEGLDPTTAVEEPSEEEEEVEKDTEEVEEEEEEEKETTKVPTSDEIMADFKNFEDVLNSINFEDLDPEETEEELDTASEEEAEVDTEEEGEE